MELNEVARCLMVGPIAAALIHDGMERLLTCAGPNQLRYVAGGRQCGGGGVGATDDRSLRVRVQS